MVNVTINHREISVPEGTTIMEAAAGIHIQIPKLCYLKDINLYQQSESPQKADSYHRNAVISAQHGMSDVCAQRKLQPAVHRQ